MYLNYKAWLTLIAVSAFVTGQYDEEQVNDRAEKLAKMMQPDGINRVVTMTGKNFKSLLKKYDVVVVFFHAQANATMLAQEIQPFEVRYLVKANAYQFRPSYLLLFLEERLLVK